MRGAFCLLALLAVVAPAPGTGFSFKVLTLNALHDKPTGDATRGEWAPHFCLRNRARLFMTEAPLHDTLVAAAVPHAVRSAWLRLGIAPTLLAPASPAPS